MRLALLALVLAAAPQAARTAEHEVGAVVDDWHSAAAAADERRYFDHLTEDSVFLGTDATERWEKAAFRAYAHPHFAKGKAWAFKAIRRNVTIAPGGQLAWFDEDLVTEKLGPCRGSGVLVKQGSRWKIAQYNLSTPIPNPIFAEVQTLIAKQLAKEARTGAGANTQPARSAGTGDAGVTPR